MKKVLFLLVAVAFLGACCNSGETKSDAKVATETTENPVVTIDSFLVIAGDYVGKELSVKGTADHVCKHGGKRIKLISTTSGESIHGEASESMGAFDAEIEGSDVLITGIVTETKIDSAYVDEWEAKEKEAIEKDEEEADMEHKQGVDHHAKLDEINEYRKQIAESEKGYISFYALEVSKYKKCSSEATDATEVTDTTETTEE